MTTVPIDDAHGGAPDVVAARDRATLAERARLLARPAMHTDDRDDALVLLGLTVGDSAYAVEIDCVREVLPRADVSRLPWSSSAIVGVMNLRGEIVPVADLGVLLGVGEAAADGPVVVLDGETHPLGVRVDTVDDVATVGATALMEPAGDAARMAGELVLGYTSSSVVLDARAVHRDSRLKNGPQEVT